MEMRDRSFYPDSPQPGHGHPSDWIAKPYSIVFTAVVFFILIFGIAIFLGWRQFETTRHNALTADKTTANLLADLILEHNKANIGILQSYAHWPLFIDAVKNKDLAGACRHLSDLKKNAEIDLTFVTDKRGLLWANFPVFPEAVGKNLSNRDWYKGVSSHWKPYISAVFKLIVGDKPLAVAVCVPIFDEKGRPIGILGNSQRLGFIDYAIERVPFSPYTTVNVIDRAGHILYSNKFPYQESITDYRFFPILEPAVKEKKQQIEINDPQKDHEKSYLTVVPVGDIGWSVILERSLRDIYRSEFRRFIEIGAISFLLFLLIIFFLIYLRKANLLRKTEELLQAETKLRQSEESERETQDYLEKLIGYANAPIIVWDPQFRITRFNHAFEDLTGLKSEEVLEREIDLLFPEDRLEECLGHIRQATGGERWEVIEIPILHRDGSVRTVLWNSATIYSPDGKTAIATIAQGQDITERKRAEEALRESEEKYQSLFHTAQVALFRTRISDSKLIEINKRYADMAGYSNVENCMAEFTPADAWAEPDKRNNLLRILQENGFVNDYETEIIRRDGTHIWILFSATIFPEQGFLEGSIVDITERKKAEDALRLSEGNFRRSLDDSPLGVRIVTIEGETLYANRAILDIYGYDNIEELKTNPAVKRYTPESFAEHQIRKEKRKRGNYFPSEYDISIVRKNGEVRYLQVFRKEILWNGERQYQVIYNDITERKRAEESLRLITDNMSDMVRVTDLQGVNLYSSPSHLKVIGYKPEERVGKSGFEIVHPDDVEHLIKVFSEGLINKKPGKVEYRIKHADGHYVWLETMADGIMDNQGEVTAVVQSSRDITDRKRAEEALRKSEEKYRVIIENMQEGYHEVDIKGNFTFFNESMRKIIGYEREELLGMNNRQYADEENAHKVYQVYNRVYRTGEPVKNFEWQIIRKDGDRRDVEVSVSLIRDREGHPAGFRGIVRDTTERKKAEEVLHASLREKEILLREIHHRVKNNMQVISSLLDLQASSSKNPELIAMFHESQSRIQAMALVHEKLYGSKDFVRIDLTGYVRTLSQDLFRSYKINPEKIDLIVQTDGAVYVDISKAIPCGLILNELISNALQHAFPRDRHGELRIIIRETKNTEIEIVVRDNGLSLPDNVDIHQPRTVGLHLVNGLVKNQLDGQIEVIRDAGTEFRIKFPL